MKKALKFFGNFVLAAVVGFSMLSCPTDGGGGKGGNEDDQRIYLLNISQVTDEWEWLAVGEDKSCMFFNADEDTGMPTVLYLIPPENAPENGITFFFKENGLPDIIEYNGCLLYFDNFDGHAFDLAVIYPDDTVEYHYGIETDKDFDAWPESAMSVRSVYSVGRSFGDFLDKISIGLKVADTAIAIGTCIGTLFFPPLVVGCGIAVASAVAELTIYALEETGVISETSANAGGYAIDAANAVYDGLQCLGKKNPLDCVALGVGLSTIAVNFTGDLIDKFSSSGTKDTVKNEMTPPADKVKVSFYANGGSGTAPALQTVEKGNSITLPSGNGLSRGGYNFLGWNTSPAASSYIAGGSYPVTRNTSLYAVWQKPTVDAPTGVTAVPASSSSIKISWNQFSGAISYYVYRGKSANGSYERVGTAYSTTYTDTGLSANTTYYYKVSYSTGPKESAQSGYAYAKTSGSSGGGGKTAPAITTASLPNGTVGTPYSHTLTATGDTPITWGIESGALPAGLTRNAGVISGTPMTAGTSNFTVRATNAGGSVTKALSITITPDLPSGNSMDEAIPLTENIWADGNIAVAYGQQWFVFTATASTQCIHAEFGTQTVLSRLVYDSSGTMVEEYEKYLETTPISTLTPGQTYYIMVTSSDGGDYRIQFNTTPYPPGTNVITLTASQWADGYLPTADDEQWFVFTATASTQWIHIEFGTLTAYVVVRVYNSSGVEVGSYSRIFPNNNNGVSRSLASGEMYYIKVAPTSSSGTYRIGFNTTATAPTS